VLPRLPLVALYADYAPNYRAMTKSDMIAQEIIKKKKKHRR
jgi:hypothetical protein